MSDAFDREGGDAFDRQKEEGYAALRVDPNAPPDARKDLVRAHFWLRVLAVLSPIASVIAAVAAYRYLPNTGVFAFSVGPVTVKGALSGCIALGGFAPSYWLIREPIEHK